ncbi:hypothetical protein [Pseudomonas sp.]|uniref:hypothetical protein n=1 Tax=Pseudomonas sp. TaxID=306 RepID=UPI003C719CB6
MKKPQHSNNDVKDARERWLSASECATKIAAELFQPGSGYADPDARAAEEHRLHLARHEAERLFREYHDLDKRETEGRIFALQNSQRLATWASFAVAAVVGIATVADVLIRILNN